MVSIHRRLRGLDEMPVVVTLNPASVPVTASAEQLVADQGQVWCLEPWRAKPLASGGAGDGAILSPMPGQIIAVAVTLGQAVVKGQKLVTVEAMKMEHSLAASFDGIVTELRAIEGAQVSDGALLVRITPAEEG